jgi:hypothetical protein
MVSDTWRPFDPGSGHPVAVEVVEIRPGYGGEQEPPLLAYRSGSRWFRADNHQPIRVEVAHWRPVSKD